MYTYPPKKIQVQISHWELQEDVCTKKKIAVFLRKKKIDADIPLGTAGGGRTLLPWLLRRAPAFWYLFD